MLAATIPNATKAAAIMGFCVFMIISLKVNDAIPIRRQLFAVGMRYTHNGLSLDAKKLKSDDSMVGCIQVR